MEWISAMEWISDLVYRLKWKTFGLLERLNLLARGWGASRFSIPATLPGRGS